MYMYMYILHVHMCVYIHLHNDPIYIYIGRWKKRKKRACVDKSTEEAQVQTSQKPNVRWMAWFASLGLSKFPIP